jgi:hypothetical protein
MSGIWIWGGAVLAYGAFYAWYNGVRGPLTPAEVDAYMRRVEESKLETSPRQQALMRAFLESDDGREFVMVNLIRAHPGRVRDPRDGSERPAREVLDGYTRHFMPALLRRAGHPVFLGVGAGGLLERWGVDDEPDWTFNGLIRYRSRRDLIELVVAPRFADAHLYKAAALERTFAFPTRPQLLISPRIVVALVLALLAAVVHLAWRTVAG